MTSAKRRESSRLARILFLLLLLATPLLLFWQRNSLYDSWRLHGYQPPTSVVGLADQDKMTDSARHIFYVNHPELMSDATIFRQACTTAEQTIILGCYHGPEAGIYIYNVQDDRLAGIQQVTAAHEMLHAAYDRLSDKDRNYVNGLLVDYYNNGLNDQRVKDSIDSYKKTEPKDIANEMHSIFGTEIVSLPQPLETYYKRYFVDRSAVTTFSANYEREFTSRQDHLNQLKSQLDSELQAIQRQQATINAEKARLDQLKANNQIEAYNAGVEPFNDLINSYNGKIAIYRRDVADYNSLLGELKALYQSIDATQVKAAAGT